MKKTKTTNRGTTSLEGRLAWLLEKLWRGSQTAMASDLGVTQGAIAHILAGRRKAGRALISALSAHPLVNSNWLLDGVGSPLVLEATGAGGEAALPIARQLFGGLPDDHPECLAEVLHPVSRRLYRRSRYWIHVNGPEHPLAHAQKLFVRAGDWVLMESDSACWPDNLVGKLCVSQVETPDGDLPLYCVSNVATNESRTTFDFDFLGQSTPEIEDHTSLYHDGRLKRDLETSKGTKKPPVVKQLPVRIVAVAVHRCGDL